jgi:dolichol-phosphate mannosyltransferase
LDPIFGEQGLVGKPTIATENVRELAVVIPTLNERANIAILVRRLACALEGISWEAIFVDDDSADGTMDEVRRLGRLDPRIRGIRRISRRGLAGAVLEGMLSTSAESITVMDGDLQHDETQITAMLSLLRNGEADVVVASRYLKIGDENLGLSKFRKRGSRIATRLAQLILRRPLSDPMSGFFTLRSDVVDRVASKLSQQGFKILLDLIASSDASIVVREVPFAFRQRLYGESKLDTAVVLEYGSLLLSKASGGLLSIRLLMFGFVGCSGLLVNLALLAILLKGGLGFAEAQSIAMVGAMTSNYTLNNALTYRDRRRRGWRFLSGLASFAALCSLGLVAGVGVSTLLYQNHAQWWLAGIVGAAMGAGWNYATTSAITW